MRHSGRVDTPLGLVAVGPVVQFRITPHPAVANALRASGKSVPVVSAKLMVDTGAQSSCVDDALLKTLGVPPRGFRPMIGVNGKPEDYPVYPMRLMLTMLKEPGKPATATANFDADIIGVPSGPPGCLHQGLLGRDFLRFVKFTYDGPSGSFEIQDATYQAAPPPAWFDAPDVGKKKAKKR